MTEVIQGYTYRDKITGFEGVAIGRTIYFTGCDTVLLQPTTSDAGKLPDCHWVDISRLEKVDKARVELLTNTFPTGGAKPAPRR